MAANSHTGDVFVTLTNGSGNNAPVNGGRDPNSYGHIIRFRETGNVHQPTSCEWDVFLFAGDPVYPAAGGTNVPADQPLFGSPDGIWADPDGMLWIQTDISNSSQNLASRGYDRIGNNQMLVANRTPARSSGSSPAHVDARSPASSPPPIRPRCS